MAKNTHYAHKHVVKVHKHLVILQMHEYIVLLIQAHTQLSTPQTETETLFTSSPNLMQVLLFSSCLFLKNLSSYSKMVTAESESTFTMKMLLFCHQSCKDQIANLILTS